MNQRTHGRRQFEVRADVRAGERLAPQEGDGERPGSPPPAGGSERGAGKRRRRIALTLALLAAVVAGVVGIAVAAPWGNDEGTDPEPASIGPESTDPPSAPDVPFAGPRTVGHAADVPGVREPGRMTRHEGDFATSKDGQVVSNLEITGLLWIRHSDVVVDGVRVPAIDIDVENHPDASARIRWSTIGERRGRDETHNAVGTGNFSLYRSEVFGAVDLLKVTRGYAVVRESWLHGGYEWKSDPGQGGGRAHVDFLQTALIADASTIRVIDSLFDVWVFRRPDTAADVWRDPKASWTATGAVSLFQHRNEFSVKDALIRGNVFRGDVSSYFHLTHDGNGPPPTKVRIVDNVIYRPDGGRKQGWGGDGKILASRTPEAVVFSDNVDQDGNALTVEGASS
ncbi:MAG TPA: hypothetical protein VM618_05760 [Acidimicrobiia bacterium]|nr:hypothetical protein [Acidimicrobiia bacterium]